MSQIEWSEKFATGITVIDAQHQRIIEYLNRLDALDRERDKASMREILFNLVDYTLSHFTFEESLMDEAGYPEALSHRQSHNRFRIRIREYQQRYEAGEAICGELIDLLNGWLFDHIAEDDNSYVPYVRANMPGINDDHMESWLTQKIRDIFKPAQ